VYTSQLGVTEATGRNDGPQVEAYQRVTGNRRGDAWCASFVAWCYKQVGIKRVGNGAAASWFKQPIYVRNTHGIRRFSQLAAKRGNTGSLFYQKLGRIGHIFFIDDGINDKAPSGCSLYESKNSILLSYLIIAHQ
jgi:hypothetical protein